MCHEKCEIINGPRLQAERLLAETTVVEIIKHWECKQTCFYVFNNILYFCECLKAKYSFNKMKSSLFTRTSYFVLSIYDWNQKGRKLLYCLNRLQIHNWFERHVSQVDNLIKKFCFDYFGWQTTSFRVWN